MTEEKVTIAKAKAKTAPKKVAVKKAPAAPAAKTIGKVTAPAGYKATRTKTAAITVDTGIAIPDLSAVSRSKYPCDILKPGESFLVSATPKTMKSVLSSVKGTANRVGKKNGSTFLTMARPEEKGVRCWRTDKTAKVKKGPAPVAAAPAPAETAPVEVGLPGFDALKE